MKEEAEAVEKKLAEAKHARKVQRTLLTSPGPASELGAQARQSIPS
jgi:hypothetical protein